MKNIYSLNKTKIDQYFDKYMSLIKYTPIMYTHR